MKTETTIIVQRNISINTIVKMKELQWDHRSKLGKSKTLGSLQLCRTLFSARKKDQIITKGMQGKNHGDLPPMKQREKFLQVIVESQFSAGIPRVWPMGKQSGHIKRNILYGLVLYVLRLLCSLLGTWQAEKKGISHSLFRVMLGP